MFSSWRPQQEVQVTSLSADLLLPSRSVGTHLNGDVSCFVGPPSCLCECRRQPPLHSLAEVTHPHIHMGGHKLQHRVNLVPEVGCHEEGSHGGNRPRTAGQSTQCVDHGEGGEDERARHGPEGEAGRSSEELVRRHRGAVSHVTSTWRGGGARGGGGTWSSTERLNSLLRRSLTEVKPGDEPLELTAHNTETS